MPGLPSWALVAMWLSGVTGLYFLSREMISRFA